MSSGIISIKLYSLQTQVVKDVIAGDGIAFLREEYVNGKDIIIKQFIISHKL